MKKYVIRKGVIKKYHEFVEMCIDFYNSDIVSEEIKPKLFEVAQAVYNCISCELQGFLGMVDAERDFQELQKEKTEQA